MSQFIDQVRIKIRSGDGGNGLVAWRREKYEPMGGPAGGNGGRGGHVYLEASRDLSTLIDFRYRSIFEADHGARGGPKARHGRQGEDLTIKVPIGTVARDLASQQVIADLVEDGQRVLIAEGGKGGRGNAQLASPTRRAPHFCEPGQPGVGRELELELKLLADVGIVGLPNAGKSTLLSVMTAARPKIADYPFTTLEPNLGVVEAPEGGGFVLADIPGLVSGAARGIGLGHKFLRHIERTRLLIHLADLSLEDVQGNIMLVNQELNLYSEKLGRLPQILVLNKVDIVDEERRQSTKAALEREAAAWLKASSTPPVLTISSATGEGIEELRKLILELLSKQPVVEPLYEVVIDERAYNHQDQGFVVLRQKKLFTVIGDRIDRLVAVTNLRSPESLHHLHEVLRAMGVIDALIKEGAKPGSEVVLGGSSFSFGEELF